ncbi:ABC transporter ATP-binding protein [Alicyclobacillus sp. SO9]|uniref:ABC transporter ATP-binding protein n=1 Tax=Alicyclobacillus sp. SO9 TaxID=2665646 RepID=UPI001E4B3F58|nr:ABC transporter ATP-binding protein [Alicyclobacillus sp. SO9]
MLELKDVRVDFRTSIGRVQAVRGVNLTVKPGEAVGIVGESGSGKSVTVQSIMRLLPKTAKIEGSLTWNGTNIAEISEKQMQRIRGRDISMIFQDPLTALNPTMKIGRQIAESLVLHKKIPPRKALTQAVNLLELVGIPDPKQRANSYPHEFSGGMRQRVVIAIAIACEPKLVIADEPTTALDVTVQAQILELLKNLQQELNMSLLFITHDLAVISQIAERVAVMYAGQIVEEGPVEQVLLNPVHPYTRGLVNSRPKSGQSNLTPIPGSPPDLLNPPPGCAFTARCPYAMQVCKEHAPPSFETHSHNVNCWLLHPQAKGGQPWHSYNYGT